MSAGAKEAAEELRELLKMARAEGVLQLHFKRNGLETTFTLGPKPSADPVQAEEKPLTEDEKLDRDLGLRG